MSLGLIGKKSGMSRVFQEDGDSIPVSIVSVFGNYVAGIKTKESDGYDAVLVSKTENKKIKRRIPTHSPQNSQCTTPTQHTRTRARPASRSTGVSFCLPRFRCQQQESLPRGLKPSSPRVSKLFITF